MFADAIEQVQRSIFPVFWKRQVGNTTQLGISGTGFFINDDGLFATACHVIDDIHSDATIFTIGNVPYQANQQEIIEEVARNEQADVFIGRVSANRQNPLQLADSRARVGRTVCISGYPLAVMRATPQGIDVRNVRQYHQQSMVLDYWSTRISYSGQRVQTTRQYECFWITNTSLPGMSGGPAFGSDGVVCGMDVATGTRKIPASGNRPEITVACGVAVHIEYVSQLLHSL
jgi:S1-C subfamily serine protease